MNDSTPLISVIVPSYNRAHLIGKTIENILSQTFKNFELIIVDDGSTDNTEAAISGYRDRIIYIKQKNKGITGARNTGLRAAKGEWIALQDSDDWWNPIKLEQQVQDLQNYPNLDVYFVETYLQRNHLEGEVLSYEHSGFSKHLRPNEFTIIDRPLHYHLRYGVAWVQTTLIRKQLLFDIGLYDEWLTLYTDYDLFCRLALKGPWGFNSTPLVRIQRDANEKTYVSSQRTKSPAKGYRNMAYIVEKIRTHSDLNAQEKSSIARRLYINYSGLGNELLKEGDPAAARTSFRRAFSARPKPGAALKCLLAMVTKQRSQSEFPPRLPSNAENRA